MHNAGMSRRHLQLVLSGTVAERLDELRRRWDPDMAQRCPPHVTVAYPEEGQVDRDAAQRVAEGQLREAVRSGRQCRREVG